MVPLSGCSPPEPTNECFGWNRCLVHYERERRLAGERPRTVEDAQGTGSAGLTDEGWQVLFGYNAGRCLYGDDIFEPNFSSAVEIRALCSETCRVNTFRAGLVLSRMGLDAGPCEIGGAP